MTSKDIDKFEVYSAYDMRNTDLRNYLNTLFGLRCIFPSFGVSKYGNTARVILERMTPSIVLEENMTEDMICRLYRQSRTAEGNDEIILSFDEKLVIKILTVFFRKIEILSSIDPSTIRLYLTPKILSTALHPGISSIYKFISTKDISVITQEYSRHNILSFSRFHAKTSMTSPSLAKGSGHSAKDLRLRFIIYQLIQVIGFIHSHGLCLDELTPDKIMLDDEMWLSIPFCFSSRMCLAASCVDLLREGKSDVNISPSLLDVVLGHESPLRPYGFVSEIPSARSDSNDAERSVSQPVASVSLTVPVGVDHYEPVTVQWVKGKLSNFEYLMIVNYAAGRRLEDPLYHPVLPWITDFSSEYQSSSTDSSCLRDLTKTKFRLSKGDAQLQTTYRHSQPPHHIPETLSELTYCIYVARNAPMQTLRRVVRNDFVPEHYPHSIARMYEWSPDECIPAFYMDESVFRSIHHDSGMGDIQCPAFAPTPESFLSYHRQLLESEAISKFLHTWIDLTFGCCLKGNSAVNNLNVPLKHSASLKERFGASPNLDKHSGFVVLFDRPHPLKILQNTFQSVTTGSDLDAMRSFGDSELVDQSNGSVSGPSTASVELREEEYENKFSLYDKDLQDFLNIDYQSKFSIIKFASDSLQNTTDFNSGSNHNNAPDAKKYLSRGVSDPSSNLLQLAKSVCIKSNGFGSDSGWEIIEAVKFADRYGAYLEPIYQLNLRHLLPLDTKSIKKDKVTAADVGVNSRQMRSSSGSKSVSDQPDSNPDPHFIARVQEVISNNVGEYQSKMSFVQYIQSNRQQKDKVPIETILHMLQAQDIQALGCIIAELYTSTPFVGYHDVKNGYDFLDIQSFFRKHVVESSPIPINIKRLTMLLLNPNEQLRPTARDILDICHSVEYEDLLDYQTKEANYDPVLQFSQSSKQKKTRLFDASGNFDIKDIMEQYCQNVFPPYFLAVYEFICKLRLANNGIAKIKEILQNLNVITNMPLEGLSLALSHLLPIISDPSPFREYETQVRDRRRSDSRSADNESDDEYEEGDEAKTSSSNDAEFVNAPLLLDYPTIIDLLGARLGVETTETILIPCVFDFLSKLKSISLLRTILLSNLWQVIINRAGPKSFLRNFLPLLITYIMSGTMQKVSKRTYTSVGQSPLWAYGGVHPEKHDFLHNSSYIGLNSVQDVAVVSIMNLALPEMLGPGVCMRYVVPPLLCLIGVPQLAVTGYYSYVEVIGGDIRINNKREDSYSMQLSDVSADSCDAKLNLFCETVSIMSDYSEHDMYTVRSLVGICMQAGDIATRELVLHKVFGEILPNLFRSYTSVTPSSGTNDASMAPISAAILEVLSLLSNILPVLSPATVRKFYFQSTTTSTNNIQAIEKVEEFSLLTLLKALPLPRLDLSSIKVDNINDIDMRDEEYMLVLNEMVGFRQKHAVHVQLCRVISSAASYVGDTTVAEFILPAVDSFFAFFVDTYSVLPVQCDEMSFAFDIGVELFVPLAQLVGPEALATAVPNLNPRLEMWLHSAASGAVGKSPPLPNNILPVESPVETNDSNTTSPGLGFFNWLSSSTKDNVSGNVNSSSNAQSNKKSTMALMTTSVNDSVHIITPRRPQIVIARTLSSDEGSADSDVPFTPPGINAIRDSSSHHDQATERELNTLETPNYISDVSDPVTVFSAGNTPKRVDYAKGRKLNDFTDRSLSNNKPGNSVSTIRKFKLLSSPISDGNAAFSFREATKQRLRRTSVGSLILGAKSPSKYGDMVVREDDERFMDSNAVDKIHSELAWLLAGHGRWRIDKDPKDNHHMLGGISPVIAHTAISMKDSPRPAEAVNQKSYQQKMNMPKKVVPAAQMSMTTPKITVDSASEAVSIFSLKMCQETSWYAHDSFSAVTTLTTNLTESLLVGGCKSGMIKIWSLNSNPICKVSSYNSQTQPIITTHFTRSGSHIVSCDGSIHVWNIETSKTLAKYNRYDGMKYSHAATISPRQGAYADIGSHGDDQLIACFASYLTHFDLRCSSSHALKPISEWMLTFPSNSQQPFQSSSLPDSFTLICSVSHEQYTCVGATNGVIWILDRRTGRIISSCHAHDGPVVKLMFLGAKHLLTVGEHAAFMWDIVGNEIKKNFAFKNLPDSSSPMQASTIILNTFEHTGSSVGVYQDLSMPSKPIHALYCMAGHKISAGQIPILGGSAKDKNIITKEEGDEVRLTRSYFTDRTQTKIGKNRLQIASAVLLPLRRILLVGAQDGSIHVMV